MRRLAATGEAYVAWHSNADQALGTYAAKLGQAGVQRAPGSVTDFNGRPSTIGADQRVAITGRLGAPGVYVAYGSGYPTHKTVNVWRIGAATPQFAINADRAEHITIAAGPAGRLWIVWDRGDRVFATRTNPAATRPGALVAAGAPPGTDIVFKTRAEGSLGPLDLFVHAQATDRTHATWHTQVLPGLTLTASGRDAITFRVTDAGDPVAGARIRVAGRTLSTNARGRASADLRRGSHRAVASKAGYTSATARVRAR